MKPTDLITLLGIFLLGMCAGSMITDRIDSEVFKEYRKLIIELRKKIQILEK